jgi:hypothetical protein
MYQVKGIEVHAAHLSAAWAMRGAGNRLAGPGNCNTTCESHASRRLITQISPKDVQPAGRKPTSKRSVTQGTGGVECGKASRLCFLKRNRSVCSRRVGPHR